MQLEVAIQPDLYEWACDRAGLEMAALAKKFPKLTEWVCGRSKPSLKQLEQFAKTTHAPIGMLFLPAPPIEALPIADFRTVGGEAVRRPSPNLLDMLYQCQQRQDWYADYARENGEAKVSFVNSVKVGSDVVLAAAAMRAAIGFGLELQTQSQTWTQALRALGKHMDDAGVLVMCSGIVYNNTKRKLDTLEFRGFALADAFAPLIFVNGSDSKSAQMFTLAHELAHIFSGETGLSEASVSGAGAHKTEQWCNAVAAEFLVPLKDFSALYNRGADIAFEVTRLAKHFKVSTLVILRRMQDTGALSADDFWQAYSAELTRIQTAKGSGGSFYATQGQRLGKRFGHALIISTLEGRTLRRDAMRLLAISKTATFDGLAQHFGVV
jgi:Zn-dependent peptidase ImmA (M78 family)